MSTSADGGLAAAGVVALKIDAATAPEVEVELDIFSGRPNPMWRLPPSERERLLALLHAVDKAVAVPSMPPGLGYRGVIARVMSGERTQVIRVGSGTVELDGKFYQDADGAVEALLLKSMPAELKAQFGAVLPTLPR